MLKPSLKDFEHCLANMEMSIIVQLFEHSLALPFFGIGMKSDLFQSCGHYWVFKICWPIEYGTLTASSFRILNPSLSVSVKDDSDEMDLSTEGKKGAENHLISKGKCRLSLNFVIFAPY